ncbi:hypothetical protein HYDPIDRAFT_84210, partial [Hydnomerulius pinastri MD-312]
DLSNLHHFGCTVFVKIVDAGKLDEHVKTGKFVGYDMYSKGCIGLKITESQLSKMLSLLLTIIPCQFPQVMCSLKGSQRALPSSTPLQNLLKQPLKTSASHFNTYRTTTSQCNTTKTSHTSL